MFVCLWSPVWRTVADSLAELSPALLTVAPRVVTEERRGGLVWVDARGLDAEHIAHSALEVLRGIGLSNVRAAVGETPIVAEIMAAGIGNRESGIDDPQDASLPTMSISRVFASQQPASASSQRAAGSHPPFLRRPSPVPG